MSTPIENNTTSLQEILGMVNALPDTGSGSGGVSVDTCKVTVRTAGMSNFTYTTVDASGTVTTVVYSAATLSEALVVCGTHISIVGNTMASTNGSVMTDNAELVIQKNWGAIFKIVAGAEETATINIIMEG